MKLRKFGALFFYYNPKDRNYKDSIKAIDENLDLLNKNKMPELMKNFNISHELKNVFSSSELKELLKTMLITGFDSEWEQDKNLDKSLFDGNFKPSDSIYDLKVRGIIKRGLDAMEKSKDPVHDLSHIVRCVRFARYLYDHTHHNLDWGIITTALVWHDISRAKNIGFLYKYHLHHLSHFPLLQDLNLVEVFFKDAYRSKLIVKKRFRRYGLGRKFIRLVGSAILGSDNKHLRFREYSMRKKYQQIIFDVDMLDMLTIGRWENMHRNVTQKKICDKHFLNRVIILNFIFNTPNLHIRITHNLTRHIAKLLASSALSFSKKFYPTDYYFAADAFREFL